jgi:cbb3-type cytochrome oxidase maturation protein
MTVLFIVLPLALLASGLAVAAFIWAAQSGQLDDLTTPAYRVLEDDDAPTIQSQELEVCPTEPNAASSPQPCSVAPDQ